VDAKSRKQTRAEKVARAWLYFISIVGASICVVSILGAAPLWVAMLSGVIAVAALWGAAAAPSTIRMALAEFLAWPWY
jgi:hypothetical protein